MERISCGDCAGRMAYITMTAALAGTLALRLVSREFQEATAKLQRAVKVARVARFERRERGEIGRIFVIINVVAKAWVQDSVVQIARFAGCAMQGNGKKESVQMMDNLPNEKEGESASA